MFVEITVGWATNSLGLISDAGHMFFDNASLFIGLYASYMARWAPDARYAYGYARYEILAGFVNAVFLVFVALSIVLEGLERLSTPPEIHAAHVLPVSVAGLAVNLIGLFFFHDAAHGHGGHGHGGHGHSHGGGGGNENMYGVWLHVLADALGSVGVICSSLLIQWYGWHAADPIASIAISLLILASAWPLVQATAGPLLSRAPEGGAERRLARAVEAVARLPGVTRVHSPHVWKHHGDTVVATLHVAVAAGGGDSTDGAGGGPVDQRVLRQARALLAQAGATVVTVQVEVDDGTAVPPATGGAVPLTVLAAGAGGGGDDDHDDHHGHAHAHGGEECGGHGHAHGGDAASHGDHGHSHAGGGHGHSHG
jgi:solute carrier family 30 (zinc transporter), member 5/7